MTIVFIVFFYPTICPALQITLAWDGSPASEEVTTYSIYYKVNSPGPPYDGTEASEGSSPIVVSVAELTDPENPQYTVTGLSDRGTYFIAITATNGSSESAYSNEVCYRPLCYPHVATTDSWKTEIAIINTGSSGLTGTLHAYGNDGRELVSMAVDLNAFGRKVINIADDFSNPDAIGYLMLQTASTDVRGYIKFCVEGAYRAAVPAVPEVNNGDVYLSHIASNAEWWTEVSIINTTAEPKHLTFEFDTGAVSSKYVEAGEQLVFRVRDLFNGVAQPSIQSAVIRGGSGTVGLELFGTTGTTANSYLSGISLKNDITTSIYYPHVASDSQWWTGIVAYNPAETDTSITIIPYSETGMQLSGTQEVVAAKEKYMGAVSGLGLPAETAWLEITAASPITGFELFGTKDGNQLAGYTGVGISGKQGVFAEVEDEGWSGIAFVNITDSAATVILTAYADSGHVVAVEKMIVAANAKVVALAEDLFTQDISAATYIGFSAESEVVGFQLNGSSDGMMLDGLPGM